MLNLRSTDSQARLIFTLTENVSLTSPFYLFVFVHVLTKAVVAFTKSPIDDESINVNRYNQFTIDPSIVFAGQPVGEWHYSAYQQDNLDNTNPLLAGELLETGKMIMSSANSFAFDKYESPTTYKAYNG